MADDPYKHIIEEFHANQDRVGGYFEGASMLPGFADYPKKTDRRILSSRSSVYDAPTLESGGKRTTHEG